MSSDSFSLHADDCEQVGGGIPISDPSDVVGSLDDLECDCWDEGDSLAETN